MAFTPDGIAPPGIALLGCSPPSAMRYRTVFGGHYITCMHVCNVNLRKLLSVDKRHVRETSLFTAILNQVRNSKTSRFVSVPGQNPERSGRGDSVVLRLQSVMMADVWWCRSGTGIGYLKEFCFKSSES